MGVTSEILIDLIEAIILLSIYQIFLNDKSFFKENKLKSLIFCTAFTAFIYWSSTNVSMLYHSLFNIVFSILLLLFVTRINVWSAALIYFIFMIIILITEMSVGVMEMMIFSTSMDQLLVDPQHLMIFTAATKMLQIGIIILLYRFDLSLRRFKIFQKGSSIYSNFIFSIGVFGMFTFGITLSNFDVKNMVLYNIMLFVLYIGFFILSIRDFQERDRLLGIKNKYQVQEYQIKNMEEIISIIREEKHDYANHINVIQALCTLNKPNTVEKIKEYVAGIIGSVQGSFKYLDTGNDYIDGLLSIKNNYAGKNGINFGVNVEEPLSTLKIKSEDLISIISNLVDNAFQAFDDSAYSKNVYFDTCVSEEKFIIEVANNGKKIPENIIKSIFLKGFSTKGDKNSDHGYGLFITRELVEKNHGSISVESDDFETVFTVIFDLNKTA